MMKIKVGTITEEVKRVTSEIHKNTDNGEERLTVELKDTTRTVAEVDALMDQNFEGSLILVDDEGTEETFSGYEFESARKSYDNMGKQLTLGFKKAGDQEAEA